MRGHCNLGTAQVAKLSHELLDGAAVGLIPYHHRQSRQARIDGLEDLIEDLPVPLFALRFYGVLEFGLCHTGVVIPLDGFESHWIRDRRSRNSYLFSLRQAVAMLHGFPVFGPPFDALILDHLSRVGIAGVYPWDGLIPRLDRLDAKYRRLLP